MVSRGHWAPGRGLGSGHGGREEGQNIGWGSPPASHTDPHKLQGPATVAGFEDSEVKKCCHRHGVGYLTPRLTL